MTIKAVMECPEGKEVWPISVLPMIVKLSLSNIAAGLGTAKNLLSTADTIKVIIEDVNNACQNLGA
ncbi:hypothetical protein KCTC32420_02272 [Aequorivita nionensis]